MLHVWTYLRLTVNRPTYEGRKPMASWRSPGHPRKLQRLTEACPGGSDVRSLRCGDLRSTGVTAPRNGPYGLRSDDDDDDDDQWQNFKWRIFRGVGYLIGNKQNNFISSPDQHADQDSVPFFKRNLYHCCKGIIQWILRYQLPWYRHDILQSLFCWLGVIIIKTLVRL